MKRQASIVSAISLLLCLCGPTAVIWAVSGVVVDSVQAGSVWPNTHVCPEVLKRLTPAVANEYATATIPTKNGTTWIVAAVNHSDPRRVSRSPFFTPCSSVGSSRINLCATTTYALPRTKCAAGPSSRVPAVALTLPHDGTATSLVGFADHHKASKSLSGQINKGWHRPSILSHEVAA